MPGIIKITRDLAGTVGNAFAWFFDSVFGWLWLAALLLLVAVCMLLTPIRAIGDGGPSLYEVIATVGGMVLIAAGGGWARYRLGEERAIKVGGVLQRLILPAVIVVLALRMWSAWEVPNIWDRPLGSLTLDDIAQNVFKFAVLGVIFSFISGSVKALLLEKRLKARGLDPRKPADRRLSELRRDFELVAFHLGQVEAFDADQAGVGLAARRVQNALAIEMRHARRHCVSANFCDFPGLPVCRLFEEPPVGHFSDADGLTVDRPARPVIVRGARLCAFVNVGKDTEMKVRILIEDLPLGIRIRAEMGGDESRIGAGFFGVLTNELPAGGAGIFEQRCAAIRGELVKRISHGLSPPRGPFPPFICSNLNDVAVPRKRSR
jgi:hypothetical protein